MSIVTVSQNKRSAFHPSPYAMICMASMAGFTAALFFSAFPGVDRILAAWFYLGDGEFVFSPPGSGTWLADLLLAIFWLVCFVAAAGFVLAAFIGRQLLGLSFAAWTFVALSLAVGPGLLTDLILQESWGRAPPVQIAQFGGEKEFTAALTRTDQCEDNCAFVSSAASNYFMLGFIAAILVAPAFRRRFFLGALMDRPEAERRAAARARAERFGWPQAVAGFLRAHRAETPTVVVRQPRPAAPLRPAVPVGVMSRASSAGADDTGTPSYA